MADIPPALLPKPQSRTQAEGQLTKKSKGASQETWSYSYDERGLMTAASKANTDGGTAVLTYTFANDVFGERIQTTTATVTQRRALDYAGGGGEEYLTLDGSNVLTVRYVNAPDGTQAARQAASGVNVWVGTDRLGSVRTIQDTNGAQQGEFNYTGFGQPIVISGAAWLGRYAYTSGEYVSDLGLQKHGARWYDPAQGRWTTEDPIGFAAGDYNLHRYVGNNATNAVDPTGLVAADGSQGSSSNDPLYRGWTGFFFGGFGEWTTSNAALDQQVAESRARILASEAQRKRAAEAARQQALKQSMYSAIPQNDRIDFLTGELLKLKAWYANDPTVFPGGRMLVNKAENEQTLQEFKDLTQAIPPTSVKERRLAEEIIKLIAGRPNQGKSDYPQISRDTRTSEEAAVDRSIAYWIMDAKSHLERTERQALAKYYAEHGRMPGVDTVYGAYKMFGSGGVAEQLVTAIGGVVVVGAGYSRMKAAYVPTPDGLAAVRASQYSASLRGITKNSGLPAASASVRSANNPTAALNNVHRYGGVHGGSLEQIRDLRGRLRRSIGKDGINRGRVQQQIDELERSLPPDLRRRIKEIEDMKDIQHDASLDGRKDVVVDLGGEVRRLERELNADTHR